MTDKTDRMVAEAKLDEAKELMEEIDDLQAEIDRKIERADQLTAEAGEILE